MKVHGEKIAISDVKPIFDRALLLGEHTDYVFGELLALEETKIDDLFVSGVLKKILRKRRYRWEIN